MTDLIRDLQKQDPGSQLVVLYELEMPTGSTLYFTAGLQANLANVTFDGNTYVPLPAIVDGIEINSEGSAARPSLTIANVLSVFKDALGAGNTYQDLLGKKFTRRRTLAAYLGTTTEYPKDVYFVDRIAGKDAISVNLELASVYDLEGIKLPSRIIIGGGCPWKYQGASPDLTESDKDGGCVFNRFSQVDVNGTVYVNFVNENDEPVVNVAAVVGAFGGTANTPNIYSTTQSDLIRINNDGTFTTNVSGTNYWQCVSNTTNSPSDSNVEYRRVRVYAAYSNSTTYTVYTDSNYNSYVANTFLGGSRLFKKRYVTQANSAQGADPGFNEHWELGDVCGKRLFSCTRRFQFQPATSNSVSVPSPTYDQTVVLPFGGFPGSRLYQ